jgi:DNA primase
MAKISDATIDSIRELSFLAILENEGFKYKRIGREAVTICPWHRDTNPSLTVSDPEGLCFCFVCQNGGDAISYVSKKLGLSFSEAIERIAFKNDINIKYVDVDEKQLAEEKARKAKLYDSVRAQNQNFRDAIKSEDGDAAREFLRQRHIEPKTSREFELGFAMYGSFYNRLTIPVHDHRGNMVGFSSRALDNNIKPKYKNSTNNEIFDKTKLVFNEHRALEAIQETGSVIFVEGHLDVISMWQSGIRNVVAMQGTQAPDLNIIRRIMKRTKRFILCYDSDDGGNKAIEQFIKVAGPLACRGELTISVCTLPEGQDPDEVINSGGDLFFLLENAPPWLDWQLDVWLRNLDRTDTAAFSNIEKTVKGFVDSIASPALRQHYIDKVSCILIEDKKGAARYAKKWHSSSNSYVRVSNWEKLSLNESRYLAEKRLIRLYIHAPETRQTLGPLMEKLQSPAYIWLWKRVQELEQFGDGIVTAKTVMALLEVAEPHYTRQLRPVALPTIRIETSPEIIRHTESILIQELITSSYAKDEQSIKENITDS